VANGTRKTERGMRGLIGKGLMAAVVALAGCGSAPPTRSALPTESYPQWANLFALVNVCFSKGLLSADDTVVLNRGINGNLGRYSYDPNALNAMSTQIAANAPQTLAQPGVRARFTQDCTKLRQQAALNRANEAQARTAQLHQAQLAAAQSQRRAAQAASWQPQPFVMPYVPSYQPPVIQTPTLRSGADFYSCRRHSSYVVSCR
jgi:hypothetical protein